MTLLDKIFQFDAMQGRRFSRLEGEALAIATEGILRHLRACRQMEISPDAHAMREIMDDAAHGRRVFAETENDLLI